MQIKSKKIIGLAILAGLLLFAGASSLGIYTYFSEVTEIGSQYVSVVITNLTAGVLTAVGLFAVSFIFAYVWCFIIKKNVERITLSSTIFDRKSIAFLLSAVCGIIIAIMGTGEVYRYVLTALNAVKSGVNDPIFGNDISYYMLIRPLLITLRSLLSTLFVILLAGSAFCYYFYLIKTNESFSYKILLNEKSVITHLFVNIAIIFLIKVIGYRFTMEEMLFTGTERVGGGYTDITVWLNFYKIIPFLLLGIIIFAFIFLYRSKYKALLITILIYPLSFILVTVASGIVQQIIVKPNEGARESKYIAYNIEATRAAYNLADAEEMEYEVSDTLNAETISDNREIVNNIRITDHSATLTAYNQLQGIRNYYQFIDADIVPYTEDGQRKAAFISARELSRRGDLADATYVNKRMKYTHGYGIAKSPVNRVTPEGQPDFLIKDIPLAYSDTNMEITQPRIYFGEDADEYCIVNTKQSELDFADGSVEYEYSYDGNAGIQLTPLNRLVYAIKYGDLNLITSSYITSESRLILNNNVLERVQKAVPFITFDSDIHIAIDSDGTLKWIVDGYTSSSFYPYSQYSNNSFNYIRNSVKAVVDAYDGTIKLYIIDDNDPIVNTYAKIYPEIFSSEPMSEELASQIKYPEWLFGVQAKIFTKYHVTNPATFYAGSDVWAIAREKYGEAGEIQDVAPYYNITSLGDSKPEFVIMLPYTLKNKDNNLVGWLGARTDNGNYGKFVSYSFPVGKHIYGTLQIENKIDNDPDISREITLWSQGGSSVMRGNMLVIPIKNSIIYVEPLYITSQNAASLPEVKRIIVAYGDNIVMETSLDAAFTKLFGELQNAPAVPSDEVISLPADSPDTLSEIKTEYENLKNAAASGNWEEFGRAMDKIDALLQ